MPLSYSTILRIEEFLGDYALTPEDEADPDAAVERLWATGGDPAARPFTREDLRAYIAYEPSGDCDCSSCASKGLCCG